MKFGSIASYSQSSLVYESGFGSSPSLNYIAFVTWRIPKHFKTILLYGACASLPFNGWKKNSLTESHRLHTANCWWRFSFNSSNKDLCFCNSIPVIMAIFLAAMVCSTVKTRKSFDRLRYSTESTLLQLQCRHVWGGTLRLLNNTPTLLSSSLQEEVKNSECNGNFRRNVMIWTGIWPFCRADKCKNWGFQFSKVGTSVYLRHFPCAITANPFPRMASSCPHGTLLCFCRELGLTVRSEYWQLCPLLDSISSGISMANNLLLAPCSHQFCLGLHQSSDPAELCLTWDLLCCQACTLQCMTTPSLRKPGALWFI